MASPLNNAAEAIREAFSHFKPEKPEDFEDFFKGLPEFLRDQAVALGALAQRADDEMPLNKPVVEELREVVALFSGMGDKADEMNSHFRNAHEVELERAHNPRIHEESWNVKPGA
jgi:hypothetical protein